MSSACCASNSSAFAGDLWRDKAPPCHKPLASPVLIFRRIGGVTERSSLSLEAVRKGLNIEPGADGSFFIFLSGSAWKTVDLPASPYTAEDRCPRPGGLVLPPGLVRPPSLEDCDSRMGGDIEKLAGDSKSEGLAGAFACKLAFLPRLPKSKAAKRSSSDARRFAIAVDERRECAASFRCHSCKLGSGESPVRRLMPGNMGAEPSASGALVPLLKLLLFLSGGDT
jgi:hypothetical protein